MAKKVYCLHHIVDCPYYRFDCSCDFMDAKKGEWAVSPRKCGNLEPDDNKVKRLVTNDPTRAILIGIAQVLKSPAVSTEYYCGHGDFTCPYYMNTQCKFYTRKGRDRTTDKPSCEQPGLCATKDPHVAILRVLSRVTNELKKIKGER